MTVKRWSFKVLIYTGIALLLVFGIHPFLYSQNHANVWYFGYDAGIDFNSGQATPRLDGMIHTDEGSAVICDEMGNLVAYSDGSSVWNANHNIVNNGYGLSGTRTTTHSAMFVPIPNKNQQYYIFTLTPAFSTTQGVCYSILNISDGDGTITQKNTPLTTLSYEKIMATPHNNGVDYWVTIPIWDSNLFKTYLITEEGISEASLDYEGPIHSGTRQYGESIMSPDKKWFCIISHNIHGTDLYKFNDETGKITHIVSLPLEGFYYGVEFSPDESKLYVSGHNNVQSVLYQYDLDNEDPSAIIESATLIGTVANQHFGSLKLGPDGRIYATKHDTFIGDRFLGVIYNPNEKGIDCNFVEDAFDLTSTARGIWGFPTTITSINTFKCAFEIENHCVNDSIIFKSLHSSEADSIQWCFGDDTFATNYSNMNPGIHTYNEAGAYYISLTQFFQDTEIICDTTIIIDDIPERELEPNYTLCKNSELTISLYPQFDYLWDNGQISNERVIYNEDIIWVMTTNTVGCSRVDTSYIDTIETPEFNLGADTTICSGDYILLQGPPSQNYLWQNGDTDPIQVIRENGIYWLEVSDEIGCTFRDSLYLTTSQPSLLLPPDTMICDNDSILLIAGTSIFNYEWFDGSTDTCMWAYIQGAYSVTATDSLGCTVTEETNINHINSPVVELGRDTGFCDYDTFTFFMDEPYTTYIWNGNDTSQVFIPSSGGEFFVTATNRCGESSDTIILEKYFSPEVYLNPDTVQFPGQVLLLNAGPGYLSYLWSNGNTEPSIYINEPGEYFVSIWNEHCKATDTIEMKRVSPFRVPNVFTPNNDGYNDDFEILGEYIDKFFLVILNRWGETLYQTNDINLRWDGTFHGRQCAEGVYFWIIRYQYPTEKTPTTIQGTVTIVTD